MFYATAGKRPLPHDPVKALIAPRPIGWISARNRKGEVNLAPYSFFNMISTSPALVMFSSEGYKDSISFAVDSGEFVCNIATYDLAQKMNLTSAPLPRGESEFGHAGLTMAPSELVGAPRVAEAAAALECKLVQTLEIKDMAGRPVDRHMVIGQVVGVHIDDRFLKNGLVDTAALQPIARCGYADYAVVDKVFSIQRPPGG